MLRKLIAALAAIVLSASIFAQDYTGGVKGTVVNRAGRIPVPGAELVLSRDGSTVATVKSSPEGAFLIEGLEDGVYAMSVNADGFVQANVNVTIDGGFVKDLIFVSLVAAQVVNDVDDSSFA